MFYIPGRQVFHPSSVFAVQSEEAPSRGVPVTQLPGDAGPGHQPPLLPELLRPARPRPAPGLSAVFVLMLTWHSLTSLTKLGVSHLYEPVSSVYTCRLIPPQAVRPLHSVFPAVAVVYWFW